MCLAIALYFNHPDNLFGYRCGLRLYIACCISQCDQYLPNRRAQPQRSFPLYKRELGCDTIQLKWILLATGQLSYDA